MNLRQERMKHKMTISELSQATRIEADVLRAYEFNGTAITANHEYRIKKALDNPKTFYGMSAFEAQSFADWRMKENTK